MKKTTFILVLSFLGIATRAFNQSSDSTAYFIGKWEITIFGTPNGDAKMIADINRIEGKLVGDLSNPAEPQAPKNPMTSITEEGGKMTIFFSASGYDLSIPFEKVDEDTIKGNLMSMFEVKAKRVK